MGLFRIIEGEAAVISIGGVEKQTDLYIRDGYLYAKAAGGYVRLNKDGSTTKPKMRLAFMTWTDEHLCCDRLGRLCVTGVPHSAPILPSFKQALLGVGHVT